MDRVFDLAISLEAAHYVPKEGAPGLVESKICVHAPAVLFGAAVPHQPGGPGRNRQWPSWWAALFAAHGFRAEDWLRPLGREDAAGRLVVCPEHDLVRSRQGEQRAGAVARPPWPAGGGRGHQNQNRGAGGFSTAEPSLNDRVLRGQVARPIRNTRLDSRRGAGGQADLHHRRRRLHRHDARARAGRAQRRRRVRQPPPRRAVGTELADHPNFTLVQGDILDADALREARRARRTSSTARRSPASTPCSQSPVRTMRVNVIGTYNALEAALATLHARALRRLLDERGVRHARVPTSRRARSRRSARSARRAGRTPSRSSRASTWRTPTTTSSGCRRSRCTRSTSSAPARSAAARSARSSRRRSPSAT